MSEEPRHRIERLGERAILVILGERLDLAVNARARRLAAALDEATGPDARFSRAVPAAASVLVRFDPLAIDPGEAARLVGDVAEATASAGAALPDENTTHRTPIEIPVHYGGSHGPDLAHVADDHGVRPQDIVELHAGTPWTVLFLGFAPGLAYLGPLPPELATARRSTPRERIPAGSVAIGGDHTTVYPFALPGGWHVIGRTDVSMWDLTRARPNLLEPGDLVRFVPAR